MTEKLPPDLAAMCATIRTIRRERQLEQYRLDSLVIEVARDMVAERMKSLSLHQTYDPDAHLDVA